MQILVKLPVWLPSKMYLAHELKNLTDKKQLFTKTGDYKQLHSNIGKTTRLTEFMKVNILSLL